MVEAGLLSPTRRDKAGAADAALCRHPAAARQSGVEYAVDAVLERLPPLAGTDRSDLIVETTIDASLQRRAQALVHDLMAAEGNAPWTPARRGSC